jgi:phospholipid/cholesterol/gamma-HCH transport system substrate-binding protein
MEPRANYLTVGLFVVGLAVALVLSILWFSSDEQVQRHTYVVYINESVAGLNVQAPVKFNGVDVGFVSHIDLNKRNPQQVRLQLEIDEDVPVNQSTQAVLQAQGITGIMYVGLQAGAINAPPLEESPGEEYPVIPSRPSLLMQVDTAVRELATGFQGISGNVQQLLNAKNQAAIEQSLANLSKISQTLASRDKGLETTLRDTQIALQNLSQQVLPSMVQAFNQLATVLAEVEPATRDLKNNPSILIRGAAPAALGPGE